MHEPESSIGLFFSSDSLVRIYSLPIENSLFVGETRPPDTLILLYAPFCGMRKGIGEIIQNCQSSLFEHYGNQAKFVSSNIVKMNMEKWTLHCLDYMW